VFYGIRNVIDLNPMHMNSAYVTHNPFVDKTFLVYVIWPCKSALKKKKTLLPSKLAVTKSYALLT